MNAPHSEILLPFPKPRAKAQPGQIKAFDNRDDRLEIANLLGHLSPKRRLAFLRWACLHATLPGTIGNHPIAAFSTVELARKARHCDRANESLTMDVLSSLVHMSIDYQLDLAACLAHLTLMARCKD